MWLPNNPENCRKWSKNNKEKPLVKALSLFGIHSHTDDKLLWALTCRRNWQCLMKMLLITTLKLWFCKTITFCLSESWVFIILQLSNISLSTSNSPWISLKRLGWSFASNRRGDTGVEQIISIFRLFLEVFFFNLSIPGLQSEFSFRSLLSWTFLDNKGHLGIHQYWGTPLDIPRYTPVVHPFYFYLFVPASKLFPLEIHCFFSFSHYLSFGIKYRTKGHWKSQTLFFVVSKKKYFASSPNLKGQGVTIFLPSLMELIDWKKTSPKIWWMNGSAEPVLSVRPGSMLQPYGVEILRFFLFWCKHTHLEGAFPHRSGNLGVDMKQSQPQGWQSSKSIWMLWQRVGFWGCLWRARSWSGWSLWVSFLRGYSMIL